MPAYVHLSRLLLPAAMPFAIAAAVAIAFACVLLASRFRRRSERRFVRMRVVPYRGEDATAEAVVSMFDSLHKRLLRRWWRRLLHGQPSVSLEVHCDREAWLSVSCPAGMESMVQAALRTAYPNCRMQPERRPVGPPPQVLRIKKSEIFIKRAKVIDRFAHQREPAMNRLIGTMGACGEPAFVQVALTPAPGSFERHGKRLYKRHEARISRERGEAILLPRKDRSYVEDSELKGGLDVQHKPLFFTDIRVIAGSRTVCERIASELRADTAENRLVERGTALRHGVLGLYRRRVIRGEGNPLPSSRRGVFASTELAAIWHLPSLDYVRVPVARGSLPLAPAPPSIMRPRNGTLRDVYGPVSIHPEMRKQNTAVPGTVEQGKSSYLVATVAEDLCRPRCAIILLDPKGDAADAAISLVPQERTCTLLDLSHPTCGFNPLAVHAPADVIADYVVAALKLLFDDADIKASSDRYLRNAIIAVLAYDRCCTLWDAARLLSVGQEGYAYRARVAARVREMPELKEISEFFTAELTAQLTDARSVTTAKLDAPVNKLARLLNSPSIKRVLLNRSLTVDFDRVIAGGEVLIVKGALGAMGAGNTSVLMQLLVGMLDASLARQQDLIPEHERVTVALKVDEAPLVLNRGFASTMALKRSAGLETVACWQTSAQWTEREVRDQLDALFAHRVYFATASVEDARESARLTMTQFSDTVRPNVESLSALGHPDARLHLPKHYAIATWSTPEGRQQPFIAETLPMRVDPQRVAWHARRQAERGGRHLSDLSQPHWEGRPDSFEPPAHAATAPAARPSSVKGRGEEGWASGRSSVADGRDASMAAAVVRALSPARLEPLPDSPAQSYRELVELDGAQIVRMARRAEIALSVDVDERDVEVLKTIASLRHVPSSEIHRRFDSGRAVTTTQRRLKRLADARLIERFQLHRQDGGGVPMCCAIAPDGVELLITAGALPWPSEDVKGDLCGSPLRSGADSAALRSVRRDVHVAAWALACERALRRGPLRLLGAEGAVLSPPRKTVSKERVALAPADLKMPRGRVPHNFLRAASSGELRELDAFETIRPLVRIEVPEGEVDGVRCAALDLLVEMDDRSRAVSWEAKLRRYDHFLTGWSLLTRRYGAAEAPQPFVVFVCQDRSRARACARAADHLLLAARAYAGERPEQWEYAGRERIVFVAERDVHEGLLGAYGLQPLPPELRTSADGVSGPREPELVRRDIGAPRPHAA